MNIFFRKGALPTKIIISYTLSVLAPLLVLALRMSIAESFNNRPLLILFMLPIILCSLIGGLWPGVIATAISALSVNYFALPPVRTLHITFGHDLLQWFTLIVCGLLVSLLSERLRQREDRYRLLVEHQTDMVIKVDAEGCFLYASPSFCQTFGKEEQDLLGKKFIPQVHEDDRPAALEAMQVLFSPPYTSYIEQRTMTPDGGYRWFGWQNTAVFGSNGKVAEIIRVGRDLTERQTSLEALRESEERLRIIADNTYDWEYWRAPGGNYLWISPAFEVITGYPVEQFKGTIFRRILEIIHPDDHQLWENHIAEAEMAETGPKEIEFRILKANGETIWISHICKPIYGSSGKFLGRRGCNRDITERRRAVEELTRSQQHLINLLGWKNNILNVSAFGMLVVTEHRIITEVNKGFVEMFGYSPEEVIGYSVDMLHVSTEMSRSFGEQYWMVTSKKDVVTVEWQLKRKSGAIFWCSLSGSALDMQDLHKGVVWIIHDITERKQIELVLSESETRFRTLFEQSMDAIAIMDSFPPRFRLVNPAFVQLFGYTQEEVHDLVDDRIWSLVYPEDLPKLQSSLRKRMEGKETSACYEFRIVRKDGEIRWVDTVGSRAQLGDKIINQSIYRDITSRKNAEEEQRQLAIKLQQAQKMEAIGTLAGGIAHDFNNILGAILGYAEMVRNASPEGSSVARYIDKVLEAGDRASALVKQILAFSRQSKPECIPLDPVRIVKDALKLLRPALPSTITIKEHFDTDTTILADPIQIHQIVINLCTNAFQAMERRGGMLDLGLRNCELSRDDLRQHPTVHPGKFIELSVGDTGPGIPPDIRNKIFDPYFTTKEVGKGTGMGLAIVHGIVSSAGGFIACESELGIGTVFKIFLPAIEQAISPDFSKEAPLPTGDERILLVDDEAIIAEIGQIMLEGLGYEVTVYTSSLEALNIFKNQPDHFDAVITDQTMPGITGIEFAQNIIEIRPEIPIILCTGYSSIVNEELAKAYGINGFVMKPISQKELAKVLRKILDENLPAVA